MKIGILGSGAVGQALGKGFAALGHDVKIGTRKPEDDKLKLWIRETVGKGSVASPGEAAKFAELAVLATAWSGTEHAIQLADPKNFVGKVVIDVTNPFKPMPNGPPTLGIGFTDSAGEQPPDMFIAGDDAGAKDKVSDMVKAFGWGVVDIGGIEGARYLEPLAMVWIAYGFKTHGWNHAFKLLRKP